MIFQGAFAAPARERAWAILVADPDADVAGLGRPLALPPAALERRLRTLPLREERPYRCDARGCFGTFFSRDGTRRVIYGRQRSGRYVGVQVWPNPEHRFSPGELGSTRSRSSGIRSPNPYVRS